MKGCTISLPRAGMAALAALALAAPLSAQEMGPIQLTARLSGTAEVAGGAEGGSGSFDGRLDAEARQICYDLSVSGIGEAQAAHIHRGAEGADGPPVVTLETPATGTSQGCVDVEGDLLMQIAHNPSEFYVNVHTTEYPAGAVRGQLSTGS